MVMGKHSDPVEVVCFYNVANISKKCSLYINSLKVLDLPVIKLDCKDILKKLK